ncbi:MAG: type II toxin-antitoxin system HicA family toxin [Pirellulales bacterium]|nr:type II toxin-antitoxin system HicA family toxin [Pirellulales bacterium]
MKRTELLKRMNKIGCVFVRSGSNHDIYMNPKTGKKQPVPRHTEIDEHLAKHILKILS